MKFDCFKKIKRNASIIGRSMLRVRCSTFIRFFFNQTVRWSAAEHLKPETDFPTALAPTF